MLLALIGIVLLGCSVASVPEPPIAQEAGQIAALEDEFGVYYAYLPTTASENPEILVLVHGTPPQEESAETNAHFYIASWVDFAEQYHYILIAPAFNQADFSSRQGDHALGGYRGLFGRRIGADEWVLRLVSAYQRALDRPGKPFCIYGHSAGGQFVGRFLVTHPERVRKAVISSAATYPQPTTNVAWPFGMGELEAAIEWDEDTVNRVVIAPDKEKWLAATQVTLTVIIGLNDTSELPSYPGQKGKNRFTIGRNWVNDMAAFAKENGCESRFKLEMIPGKGHSMSGLVPYVQQALVSE